MAVFGFRKKKKVKPESIWKDELGNMKDIASINPLSETYKIELTAFTLGFLSEYLKQNKVKDKYLSDIIIAFYNSVWHYQDEERVEVEQRIARSTSSNEPLLQEMVINGIELFDSYNQDKDNATIEKKIVEVRQLCRATKE